MGYIDKAVCVQLAGLLKAYEISRIVVSPGSRNAPIVATLNRDEFFTLHYIVDERQAAFFALGMSIALQQPVAVVCTSGTAVLNLAPALAEAYYSRVPLIAITADRPEHRIDQRESQTIRQTEALRAVTRRVVDLHPDNGTPEQLHRHNLLINDALQAAFCGNITGPIQINVQLEMPLTPICHDLSEAPFHYINQAVILPSTGALYDEIYELVPQINQRVLVIIGSRYFGTNFCQALKRACREKKNIAVIAEVQSGCASIATVSAGAVELAVSKGLINEQYEPDLVICIGGSLVSERLKSMLQSFKHARFISVGYDDHIIDTYRHLDTVFQCHPEDFFSALALYRHPVDDDSYPALFKKLECETPQNERIMRLISEAVPSYAQIHISNGMSIRRAQWLDTPDATVWCNRGVSGIDGCTSTAIGAAAAHPDTPTLLISGDMCAAYDITALSIKPLPVNFRMIVLDNNGGDIFRRVKTTAGLPEREEYFCAMPSFPLDKLARAYGLEYQRIDSTDLTARTIEKLLSAPRPAILHIVE